ncbi:MAG: DUF4097 family beta strand repeat-containing protein [Longimicrobiales bacterium]
MPTRTSPILLAVVASLIVALPAAAQLPDRLDCGDDYGRDDREHFCEVREVRLDARDALAVDGHQNGGVRVAGWDRNEIVLQAKIQTWARQADEARALAQAVRIETDDVIRPAGPQTERRQSWGVSFLIFVPRNTDLDIETHNGGISLSDVSGRIRFNARNGGIRLTGLSGDVRGRTTNGGLHVQLTGDRWQGAGLDIRTTNGGVRLHIPENYSANLETGTVNGGLNIDFPVTVQGRIGRELTTTLGQGGATVRVTTTNGGVRIARN